MQRKTVPAYLVALMILLLPGYTAAEIYKCKGKDGGYVYSDKKCSDKAEKIELKKDKKSLPPTSRPFHCISGISAVVNNLHYPTLKDVNEAIRLAESDCTNLRYRKLIKQVDPSDKLPDRVTSIRAEAFLASEVPGFSNGVVVNVKICK